mgnify:FL=1
MLSSLFGGGPKTNVIQTRIPEELAPYVKEVMREQQQLYRTRLGETPEEYQYQGQSIADLSRAQQEARTGIRGLVSGGFPITYSSPPPTSEPGLPEVVLPFEGVPGVPTGERLSPSDYRSRSQDAYGRAYDQLANLGERFTDTDVGFEGTPTEFSATKFEEKPLEEYMNPFQRAVTDVAKRKASEDFFQKILPQLRSQQRSRGRGSALGSRGALVEAQLRDDFGTRLGDIEAVGLEKAYQDAVKRRAEDFDRFRDQRGFEERGRGFLEGERDFRAQQFRDQKTREEAAAKGIASLVPQEFGQRLKEYGALERIGAEDQALEQSALDRAYADYLERRERPETLLARYTQGIYGNPLLATPSRTETRPGVGLGQQLLGFGSALLSAAGGIPGLGAAAAAGGGGAGALPVTIRTKEGGYLNRNMGGGLATLNPTMVNAMGEIIRQAEGSKDQTVGKSLQDKNQGTTTLAESLKGIRKKAIDNLLLPLLVNQYRGKGYTTEAKNVLQNIASAVNPPSIDPNEKPQARTAVPPQANANVALIKKSIDNTVDEIGGEQGKPKVPLNSTIKNKYINQNNQNNKRENTGAQTGSKDPSELVRRILPQSNTSGVNTSSISTQILLDSAKDNEYLKDIAKKALESASPEKVSERFKSFKTASDAAYKEIEKNADDNLNKFLTKIKSLDTPTDLPGMLFYIGIGGASDPDGFFAGAAKGLKEWSKDNIKEAKERKEFKKQLATFEFQGKKDVLELAKEGKLANLNLTKEQITALSKLPAEQLAIISILNKSKQGQQELRIKLLELGTKRQPVPSSYDRDDLLDLWLYEGQVANIHDAKFKNVIGKDPRARDFINKALSELQNRTVEQAERLGKKVGSGDVKREARKNLQILFKNREFLEMYKKIVAEAKSTVRNIKR